MSLTLYGFVVLLSFCGLRYVECNPAFTSKPNGGATIHVRNGESALTLTWGYNSAGEIVEEVYLYVEADQDVLVAAKYFPSNQFNVFANTGYTGRVEFSGSATFTIKNIVPSDSRRFKCVINFNTPPQNPGAITAINSAVEVVVVVQPSIELKSPSSIELNEHETTQLLCVASGNPKPSYTWKKDSVVIQQDSDSNYTITSAKKEDKGQYTCEAVVSAPGLSIPAASYIVDIKVRFAPQVTSLLWNQTLDEGSDASFICRAEAYPVSITFYWFKNLTRIIDNAEFSIVSSGSESRLTVKQIKKDSADRYSCSGQNAVGTGERKSVLLEVRYAPKTVTVTTSPSKVNEGQSMTLTCHSDGFPDPTFSWRFNNRFIARAVKNDFLLANAEVSDSGNYTCIVTNIRGTNQFTKVVNVQYEPTVTNFTTGNDDNSAVKGSDATLTCSANGFPIPQYVIKRNKTEVISNGPGRFVVRNVQLSAESDTYSCEPFNDLGRGPIKELKITVYVPPYFPATSLSRANKTENDTHTFSCTAEGKPQARILWMLGGKNLTHTPPYNISESFSKVQDSKLYKTLGYLTITSITWREKGLYSCVAYNPAGQTSQSAELNVKYRPVVQFQKDHPKNQTLAEGQDVTFDCKMIGNPRTVRHKWQFNGVDIPGASCDNGCPSLRYTKSGVTQQDAGLYSCIGWNELGYGPPATAELFVKHPPKIRELPQSSYTVNETNSVTMVCYTEGVPRPTVTWKKASNEEIVGYGEVLTIANITGRYDGKYTCTAENELGTDSKRITLHVQTRPVITTSTPLATNVPGAENEVVKLSCIAKAKPPSIMSWKRNLNGDDLRPLNGGKVKGIQKQVDSIELTVETTSLGEQFYCVAVNLLGSDSQVYTIRKRGPPDPPQDVKLVSFPVPEAKTVSVNVSWTPGYDGGFRQEFSIHYRRKGAAVFTEQSVGNPPNDMHTVQQLRPQTDYEFKVLATNERGKSQASPVTQVMTIESAKPPDRGTVKATRSSDDHSVIIVTWTVMDERVTTLRLEMTEGSFRAKRDVTDWKRIPGSQDVNVSYSEFRVENLNADKAYTFRVGLARNGEDLGTCGEACYVYSDPVAAAPVPDKKDGSVILEDWMIAIIAAVAGFLLLSIVLLCLCCFIRRKKSHGADRVNMSQSSNYAVGGPEVSRSLDPRPRSYGLESVEDDPFIEAHFASMQSMTTANDKKKKPDNSVNYGYLSQDSVQNQPERLLEPGSRLARNRPVAQSTGNLGSAYPASGPQRDLNTLPPYYEPPSFEEAMRQSGKKQKTRKSTGDLVGPGQGRHAGRRPRQSTTDEPTDSSDGEGRYVPHRAAPPPPRVRHVESQLGNPDYATEDHRGTDSRGFPRGPSSTSAPRNNGSFDPSVPYALPQKKLKSRRSRGELNDPTVEKLQPPIRMYGRPHHWQESHKGWPPPQYTREERSSEDLMQHSDLDLDDPSSLPLSERPSDLPPPMALLSSNQFNSSYYDSATDGLPEPPAFLRDVVYPPGDRELRYDYSDDAAPYEPPSPGPAPSWQRQPYVNINGQLHKAPSRDYTDFARPNPLRSSRDRLTPEPEMPPREWEMRRPEHDERSAPAVNYVSHLV